VRLAGNAPLHFLVADAKGDVAALEFLNGTLVVHRGETLPVPALANDPYTDSLAGMKAGANDRFARAGNGLATAATLDGAFALLDRVRQPSTQWSIVYDIPKRTVHWHTANNREHRSVALAAFNFRCAAPVLVLDIDKGRGNVAALFREYTTAQNLALIERSTRNTSFLRGTPNEEIEESAKWPERSVCR
jgi:choloylglycine hydrolase